MRFLDAMMKTTAGSGKSPPLGDFLINTLKIKSKFSDRNIIKQLPYFEKDYVTNSTLTRAVESDKELIRGIRKNFKSTQEKIVTNEPTGEKSLYNFMEETSRTNCILITSIVSGRIKVTMSNKVSSSNQSHTEADDPSDGYLSASEFSAKAKKFQKQKERKESMSPPKERSSNDKDKDGQDTVAIKQGTRRSKSPKQNGVLITDFLMTELNKLPKTNQVPS